MNDIIAALAGSPNPQRYWTDMKRDMKAREGFDVYAQGVKKLRLPGADGRMSNTDCANRETVLRVIQSVKSPNAEPFKRWLAQVGEMALEEAEEDANTRSIRAEHRFRLYELDTALHELVEFRGITTPEQHARLRDSNYAGMYSVATRDDLIRIRRLPFASEPEEFMGVMEMAANIFQRAGVASLVHQRNLQGEDVINATAEDVGVEMRLMMQRMGMPMPETLPRHRRLTQGEWMTPELLRSVSLDWDETAEEVADRVIPIYELVEGDSEPRLIEERHLNPKPEGQ